jgi:hypothetical protein
LKGLSAYLNGSIAVKFDMGVQVEDTGALIRGIEDRARLIGRDVEVAAIHNGSMLIRINGIEGSNGKSINIVLTFERCEANKDCVKEIRVSVSGQIGRGIGIEEILNELIKAVVEVSKVL